MGRLLPPCETLLKAEVANGQDLGGVGWSAVVRSASYEQRVDGLGRHGEKAPT